MGMSAGSYSIQGALGKSGKWTIEIRTIERNIYKRRHTRGGAVAAILAGVASMTIMMVFCNLVFTPIFMGTPIDAVIPRHSL